MLALISRALTLVGAVVSDSLLADHAATGVEQFNFEYSSLFSRNIFSAFVRWDSVHMLKIATEGYRQEHQLVFFPLFPALIRAASSFFCVLGLTRHEELLCAALLLNFVSFVLAHQILKRLLKQVSPSLSAHTLDLVAFMFCFNPAGVFFSVAYTESLFSLLSWSGFLLYTRGNDFASIIPLCLASFLRSNGSLNIVVIGLVWLGRPAHQGTEHSLMRDASILLVTSAILMPGVLLNTLHLHILCSESLLCATCLCPVDVSNLLPALSSWLLYNSATGTADSPLQRISTDTQTIALCSAHSSSSVPPIVYSYLQGKYWGAGFLRQYQWRQAPNFMLALPIWCVVAYTLYYAKQIFPRNIADTNVSCKGTSGVSGANSVTLSAGTDKAKKTRKSKHKRNGSGVTSLAHTATAEAAVPSNSTSLAHLSKLCSELLSRPETPYLAHLLVLLVVGMLFAHVQMNTRLICASSPIIYVGLAHIAESPHYRCNIDMFAYKGSISWVYVYLAIFNIVGIAMHCNYYPWT